MGRKVLLNYDELRTAVKKFRNEGEDIVQMHSTMRDRVHDLYKDWVGEGADKFFREMENDLLPALSRLANALFYAQDVLQKIIKTIQTFDEDTAGYFRADFDQVNPIHLGAFLAGAGSGAGIGSMVGGSLSGGVSGAGSGVGGASGGGLSGSGSGDPGSGTGEPLPDPQAGSGQTGGVDQTPEAGGRSPGAGAGVGAGGGGGGGGSSSQGLQGNLQGMGVGVAAQGGAGAGEGSIGGGSKAPDHIYDGSSEMGAGGSSTQTSRGSGSAGGGAQGSAGAGAVAAGAAGVAGSAAIAGAAKSIKGRVRKKKE